MSQPFVVSFICALLCTTWGSSLSSGEEIFGKNHNKNGFHNQRSSGGAKPIVTNKDVKHFGKFKNPGKITDDLLTKYLKSCHTPLVLSTGYKNT